MNEIVIRSLREARTREIQRSLGQETQVMRSAATAAGDTTIADPSRMPVIGSTQTLQDGSGHFYFLADYSTVGGTDIVK